MAFKKRIRVRKDTEEQMDKKAESNAEVENRLAGSPDAEKEEQFKPGADILAEDENKTMLFPVKRSRVYQISIPPKDASLDPKLEPKTDDPLGRAARNFALLCKAEDEIAEDRKIAHKILLDRMKKARKPDMQFKIGKSMAQVEIHHKDASEEVKIKWA